MEKHKARFIMKLINLQVMHLRSKKILEGKLSFSINMRKQNNKIIKLLEGNTEKYLYNIELRLTFLNKIRI